MKKIDLHIHTIRSISDSKKIDFSVDKLSEYIDEKNLMLLLLRIIIFLILISSGK